MERKKFNRISFLCFFLVLWTKGVWAFAFDGEWDLDQNQLRIFSQESPKSFVAVNIDESSPDAYTIGIKTNHFQTPFFDISSDMKADVAVRSSPESGSKIIEGTLSSQYSLIDYKPVKELSGRFEFRHGKLWLENVSFGKIICNGSFDMRDPFYLNLTVQLSSIPMVSFLAFWTGEEDPDTSGLVSGKIQIQGPLDKIFLDGKLESFDGHVADLIYNKFLLNIEGVYPRMRIRESAVSQSEGMAFTFQGSMDLSQKQDFLKQVSALKISPLIRDTDSQLEWTLRSSGQKEKGKTELKYLMRKDPHRYSLDNEGMDMFGVENSFEF